MKLQTKNRSRERLLVYGGEGAGKTYDWFSILNSTPDDVTFYVIDTDQTVLPFIESEEFSHLGDRIEFYEPFAWDDAMEMVEKYVENMGEDDWFVIDMLPWFWGAVQDYFTDRVFGRDSDEMWLAHREAVEDADGKGSANPFDGMKDWTVIKKLYRKLTMSVVRAPGHVFLAAGEKELIEHFESSATMKRYEGVGAKPAGEKNSGHIVRTVLRKYKTGTRDVKYRMTTVKDRQREDQQGVEVTDFARDYLLKVAGWRPVSSS